MVVLSERPAFRRKPLPDDPGSVSSLPDFFLAHELAHQWWGHGVAGENYHERWLSEGAAQYAAALWVRQSHGETAFREALRRMSRWALRESDKGPISLGYRLGHLRDDPQVFRAVVYDKGAYVLLMLRAILGGDLFPKVLRSLLADHRFGKVGTDDFREALEAASGKSLAPYFEAWVYGTAVPALHLVRWSEVAGPESHGAVVEVKAEGLPGPVPLELAVTHDGGRKTERVTLQPGGGAFMVETEGRPKKVEINADYGLLAAVDGR